MTRTTPPRPADLVALFPELLPLARTATRLHPRPGSPTPRDSSAGGPLLWPADEPWPYCAEPHAEVPGSVTTPAEVRLLRRTLTDASSRPIQTGVELLTADEQAVVQRIHAGRPWVPEPVAMLPVAQLYLRDIPDLRAPAGTDLLQVLWCPFEHPLEYLPKSKLIWRSSEAVTAVLTESPAPIAAQSEDYVPEPCVVHPEQVVEYPTPLELDPAVRARIEAWSTVKTGEAESGYYQYELSVAPGWKVGGWGPWSFRDPQQIVCVCGTELRPLLTIDSREWHGGSKSWIPLEDRTDDANPHPYRHPWAPVMVTIGRSYSMQIYICPVSFEHPHVELMQ
jgi:hypothetical protein